MISTDLAGLSNWLIGYAARSHVEPADQQALAHLAHCLLDLSRQAAKLEQLPVDDGCLAPAREAHGDADVY